MPARDLREHANRLLSFAAAAQSKGYLYLAELYTAAAARDFQRATEVEKSTSGTADSAPSPTPTDGWEWSQPPWKEKFKRP